MNQTKKKLDELNDSAMKLKQVRDQLDSILFDPIEIDDMRRQIDSLTDNVIKLSRVYLPTIYKLEDKQVIVTHKEYFDNSCKGEDMWGHFKTANGDLYIVADGASGHEGNKTGGDVVEYMMQKLTQEAPGVKRSWELKELMHTINDESAKINEGAYAAVAGILYRGNKIYSFSAGDVSIIAKKPNGKLLQVLPLDLSMEREEAEIVARTEIGTVVNGVEITELNYEKRVDQYMNHGLCNAVGFGESFYLNEKSFNAKDGAAILIASDGVTDPFMRPQKKAGSILRDHAPGIYEILNANAKAEDAAEALKDLVWDTQIKEKRKIKADDRTGLFLYMNHQEDGSN